jgi:2-(1,2-epoxy-1,2-dihydrophenyl)acetyl-CoA isomerase
MSALSYIVEDDVATLAIECHATSNSIDLNVIRGLHGALDEIAKRENGVGAVVITGGGKAFCSGLNLHSVDLGARESRQRAYFATRRFMDPLIARLSEFRYPIIAAVNGGAAGAGMSLALACDIIVAGENSYFLPSFARRGIVPDAGITFHLARRVGTGRALSSLLLADRIDAQTALQWGLCYAVVPDADVLRSATAIARRLAKGPRDVLGQMRSLLATTFHNSLQQQLRAERAAQETMRDNPDCLEGVSAFFEKREPHFSR